MGMGMKMGGLRARRVLMRMRELRCIYVCVRTNTNGDSSPPTIRNGAIQTSTLARMGAEPTEAQPDNLSPGIPTL